MMRPMFSGSKNSGIGTVPEGAEEPVRLLLIRAQSAEELLHLG
jgi:hypothetical protein